MNTVTIIMKHGRWYEKLYLIVNGIALLGIAVGLATMIW